MADGIKYIINASIHGYETLKVTDLDKIRTLRDSFVAMVIGAEYNNEVADYYKAADEIMRGHNKLVLVSLEDDNKLLEPLATLMVTYRCYDIYTVPGLDDVTGGWLAAVEEREADISEVESFIGGDITAYNELGTFLYGIEALVSEGDTEGLIKHITKNLNNIANLSVVMNSMKIKCNLVNSEELLDKIAELSDGNRDLMSQLEDNIKNLSSMKKERDKFKNSYNEEASKSKQLEARCNELEANNGDGRALIKSFNTSNTQLYNCKTKFVLYFREISYIRYMNTLVNMLFRFLELSLKVKLVIYDDNTNLYSTYNPLPILNSRDYANEQDMIVNKTPKFVMTEPNPTVLEDILKSEQCFDVVIVYDRLKAHNDIVSGNNVTKFFVINSSKDFKELAHSLEINDTQYVITNTDCSIGGNQKDFLDIQRIEDFNVSTDTAKLNKYTRLKGTYSDKSVMQTILDRSRISSLIS